MADDDSMDSDSYAGSNRSLTADSEQEEETLPQLQLSSILSEVTADLCDQEETFMDNSSLKKKAQCFSLLSDENQEVGLHSSTENASLSASFEKEVMDDVKTEDGLSGVQEVDSQINVIETVDDDNKEHLATRTLLEFEEKKDTKGKAVVSGNLVEAEKKRPLADLGGGKLFGAKTCSGNSSGLATNLSKIDDKNGIKGLDFPVTRCLKIAVIDDTALIEESYPVARTGNASSKDGKKKGKQEIDGKKARRSRRSKNMKMVLQEAERHKESTKLDGVQNGRNESNARSKIMYSKEELKALRFLKVAEQQNFWRYIYNGLDATVTREYDDLGSWKNRKNIGLISDTPQHSGVVAGRGTRNGLHTFVH